jgi:hypothetical protein
MTSAWDRVHARYQLAAGVLREAARTGDGAVAEQWRAQIEDVFGDFGAFLLHVQRRWFTALEARLDACLEAADNSEAEFRALLARVWTELAADDPGTRAVLDAYADHAAVRTGEARHRHILGGTDGCDSQEAQPFRAQWHGPDAPDKRGSVPLARGR